MISRYSRPSLRELWSDQNRYDTWLKVELAACRAMEAEGRVPNGTAANISKRATGKLNAARILEIEERTRHDVIAFLTHVEEIAGEEARFLHLGMTSSDVLDTSFALVLVAAIDEILAGLDRLQMVLKRRAEEERHTAMIGRSHGMHAEPITAGLVFAGFYAEAKRNQARLLRAKQAISFGKIAGAVGTYANLSPAIEQAALTDLGLQPETVATQVVPRDRHAEVFSTLALLGASIERMANTFRHWQRTEVGEAEEPFGKGQKGSSAMPHKKNPILSENLTGLARMLRSTVGPALENVALWHERDISHSSVERLASPDATALADFMLARATTLVDGLELKRDRMRENLDRSRGLIFSEAVLLALVQTGLPRQRAYEMVQRSALAAHQGGEDFRGLLAADTEVTARLDEKSLAACFNLKHHLRHVDSIIDRALRQS